MFDFPFCLLVKSGYRLPNWFRYSYHEYKWVITSHYGVPVVWVIGDSFVHWMSRTAARYDDGTCLQGFEVRYFGRRGLRLSQYNDFLHETWSSAQQTPDCVYHPCGFERPRPPAKEGHTGFKQQFLLTWISKDRRVQALHMWCWDWFESWSQPLN